MVSFVFSNELPQQRQSLRVVGRYGNGTPRRNESRFLFTAVMARHPEIDQRVRGLTVFIDVLRPLLGKLDV
ncbi:MAG: hypothetical protein P8181_13260 [bacterium]